MPWRGCKERTRLLRDIRTFRTRGIGEDRNRQLENWNFKKCGILEVLELENYMNQFQVVISGCKPEARTFLNIFLTVLFY